MKLSVIIPVYNEKDTILQILKKIEQIQLDGVDIEIILVDDHSTDGTRDILRSIEYKYKIIFHQKNQGKGRAIRAGLAEVTGNYVVIQDADLEYDPRDFAHMIEKMVKEKLPVLYGSRRLNKNNVQFSGITYYLGGILVTEVTNLLYRQSLTDEPTCYKMFNSEFLRSIPLTCERFEFCPEVTARIARRGIKILEVPISYYPRHKNEGKKIRWRDGAEALFVLLKHRLY